MTRSRTIALISLPAVACVIVALALSHARFGSTSVCAICGARENATEWQIPLTSLTYWRTSASESTVLSAYLEAHGYVPPHTHKFIFAAGGGNGVLCAIGRGRHLWTAVDSPEVPTFLDVIQRCDGPAARLRWQAFILDPEKSAKGLMVIDLLHPTATTTRSDLETWRREWQDTIPEAFPPP